jgi:hypothetical protein
MACASQVIETSKLTIKHNEACINGTAISSKVKNCGTLHRTFNVEPLYVQYENWEVIK